MAHPLFSLLLSRPELAFEHAAGYAELLREEAVGAGSDALKRGAAWAVALLAFAVFLVLAGTAAMFGALLQFHWVLLVAPGVPLVLALLAWSRARTPLATTYFAEFKAQLDADAEGLRRAGVST